MKRFLLFSLLFMLFSVSAEFLIAGSEGAVTTNALKIRIRPGLKKPDTVISILKKGDKVNILGEQDGWYEITVPENAAAWVNGSFLKDDIVAKEVKVRSGPGVAYTSYSATLKSGQKIKKTGEADGDWIKIVPTDNLTGWISAEFISLSDSGKTIEKTKSGASETANSTAPQKTEKITATATSQEKQNATLAEKTSVKNESPEKVLPKTGNKPEIKADTKTTDKPTGKNEKKTDISKEDIPYTDAEAKTVSKEGTLVPVSSDIKSVKYCLASKVKDEYFPLCYVRSGKLNLKLWEGQKIQISGKERWIKGWKRSIVEVDTVVPGGGTF